MAVFAIKINTFTANFILKIGLGYAGGAKFKIFPAINNIIIIWWDCSCRCMWNMNNYCDYKNIYRLFEHERCGASHAHYTVRCCAETKCIAHQHTWRRIDKLNENTVRIYFFIIFFHKFITKSGHRHYRLARIVPSQLINREISKRQWTLQHPSV